MNWPSARSVPSVCATVWWRAMNDAALENRRPQGESTGRRQIHAGMSVASWTRLKKTVAVGIKSIYSHGLRSLLTVLGIVIGVAAVIAMLAVSEGASFEAQEQFRALGSNNIIVKSVKPPEAEASASGGFRQPAVVYGLTYQDI